MSSVDGGRQGPPPAARGYSVARETIEAKAARYLLAGRVSVLLRTPDGRMRAVVDGDTGVHLLGYDPRFPGWRCLCDARKRCCHMVALELITGTPPAAAREILRRAPGQDAHAGRLW